MKKRYNLINILGFITMESAKTSDTPIIRSNGKILPNVVSEASDTGSSLDQSFESCANSYDFCVHFIHKT